MIVEQSVPHGAASAGAPPRRAIATALAVTAAFAATLGVVPPLLPAMGANLGLSDVGAAWIVSAFALARLVVDLPAGLVLERIGRRRGFVTGGLLVAASGVLSALSPAPWLLYLARAVGGVGHCLTSLTVLVFVLAATPPHIRSRAGSLVEFTVVSSLLLAGLAAGPVSARLGWRGALAVVGLLALAATVVGARLPWAARREKPAGPTAGGGTGTPAEVAPAPAPVAPVIAASFSVSFTWSGLVLTLLPLAAASRLGLDATGIGRVLSFNYAADLLLLLPIATLADRTGGAWWILTAALGLAAVAAPSVLLAPSAGLLSSSVFVVGASLSAWMIPATLLLRAVPVRAHARTLSLFRFTGDLAAFVGPVAAAAVYQWGGVPAAALLVSLVPLGAASAMVAAGRRRR